MKKSTIKSTYLKRTRL